MKFTVQLKDPDGFFDSVRIAVDNEVAQIPGLSRGERADVLETRLNKTWEDLEKFVTYQEYVTIEFDTEAGTATVVPARK